MKITKVDGRKVAVKKQRQTGYIYLNKTNKIPEQDNQVRKIVERRIRQSQNLYSAFSKKKLQYVDNADRKQLSKNAGKIQNLFDKMIKDILVKDYSEDEKYRRILDFKFRYEGVKYERDIIDMIVMTRLRNSLKKIELIPVVENILYAFLDSDNYKIEIEKIDKVKLYDFMKLVYEDYHKGNQKNTIIKSIEKQNLKVQVYNDNNEVSLKLSKTENNPELQKIITEIVCGNEKKMLDEMNQALIHFFPESQSALEDNVSYDIKIKLEKFVGSEIRFSEEVENIIGKYYGNELSIQTAKEKIRTSMLDECFSRKRRCQELSETQLYWIDFIAEHLQHHFKKPYRFNMEDQRNNSLIFYVERSWKNMLECIATQFINLGKAVYHFAMPKSAQITNEYGEVLENYRGGITSFEYEVSDGSDIDIFSQDDNGLKKHIRDDAVHSSLRFFGGASRWENMLDTESLDFVKEFRAYFNLLRHQYFHYTKGTEVKIPNEGLIAQLIMDEEMTMDAKQLRLKYYSNNVPMFYGETKIQKMMDKLYSQYAERPAQIPAFNRVLKKKSLNDFYKKYTNEVMDIAVSEERIDQFKGMYYFLLKEIYYYGFLPDERAKEFFFDALKNAENEIKQLNSKIQDQRKRALENFQLIVKDNEKEELGGICQAVMGEYALQNNRNTTIQKKYDHYPILLCQTIQEAFLLYLQENQNIFGFLKQHPKNLQMPDKESFMVDWNCHRFDFIFENMNSNIIAWHIMAHFIPAKEVNQLIGNLKSYIQFITDIEKRAKRGGITNFSAHSEDRVQDYKRVIFILDYVLKNCKNQFSNQFSDYYSGDEDSAKEKYAEYLSKFVKFANKKNKPDFAALLDFCSNEDFQNSIYVDAKNPIVIRNIELARMYGLNDILPKIFEQTKPINRDQLKKFEYKKKKISKIQNGATIMKEEEQKEVREFQQIKNRLELHNLLTLSQITNDLLSELVSLAYIRERDLFYYQLGFYYYKLKEDKNCPQIYHEIIGKDCCIKKGAILYQIEAMYTYGKSIFLLTKDGFKIMEGEKKPYITSEKISKLAKELNKENGYFDYNEGLRFFGSEKMMNKAVKVRNMIDHNHYFTSDQKKHRSLLAYYSDVYDLFFTYSRKLKKSVPVMLKNTLKKYNLLLDLDFNSSSKSSRTELKIKNQLVKSDVYTYKVKSIDKRFGKENNRIIEISLDVWDSNFLDSTKRLLDF
ncbi:MAG: type VI-A CRISPR-associated RNA-guided ribonuclease Cas13a [Lachnospiraceae bacterium]|nr:type VI-A CRISPR-associated RNA-guided ribonuclease Cas13a [Lachnospiraceae bacterium]